MTPRYFCHYCQVRIRIPSYLTLPTCPYCHMQFVEEETSHLGMPSDGSVDALSWLEPPEHDNNNDHDDDGQDHWYDTWHLEFLPTQGRFGGQQQHDVTAATSTIHHQPAQAQLWEQDDEDALSWFPAEDGHHDQDSISSWVTDRSRGHDDNKSELGSNNSDTPDEQQWVTDEDDDDDGISTTYPLLLSIDGHRNDTSSAPPSNDSLASSPSSTSLSLLLSSSLSSHPAHPSGASSSSSSFSSAVGTDQHQPPSTTATASYPSSSSNHRQSGLFRIERLLDMIYQGYSESDNELDDTHYNYSQGFMDNLMDIFSDPMETPQTSINSDIGQCIERLSKRTLLGDDSDALQECTICQEPFGATIEIIQMPCQHEYHSPCLSQWLYVNATCPICRCPASSIVERTPPPPPLSLAPLPSPIMQRANRRRRYSYPVIPEDHESSNDADDNENNVIQEEEEGDDEDDDRLSEYYEVTDPPPFWARSSSSSAAVTTSLQSSSPTSSSRPHLALHYLHDY